MAADTAAWQTWDKECSPRSLFGSTFLDSRSIHCLMRASLLVFGPCLWASLHQPGGVCLVSHGTGINSGDLSSRCLVLHGLVSMHRSPCQRTPIHVDLVH